MRDDMLDLITSDVAELRQQVNALNNYVSDMATEYSIRALTDRMEELENIAYYFEGASEDVQNWLFENNAKALRFSGEGVYDPENIWLMADEYVHYNSHTDSSARLGDYMNSIMSSYNLPYDINYKKMYNFGDTISNSTQVVRIMSAIFNKSTVDLSDKILSFRMNPLFFSGKPISVVLFITDYVDEQGNVFDYKVSINSDEVDAGEGQVQIIMPSDYTSLHIYPFRSPTSRGDTTNNQRPVNDITAMGLWVIEDMGEPDGPGGALPDPVGRLTIDPVVFTHEEFAQFEEASIAEKVAKISESLSYDGGLEFSLEPYNIYSSDYYVTAYTYIRNNRFNPSLEYRYIATMQMFVLDEGQTVDDIADVLPETEVVSLDEYFSNM